MTVLLEQINRLPDYAMGVALVVAAVLIGFVIWKGLSRSLAMRRLRKLEESPEKATDLFTRYYGASDLVKIASTLERAAKRHPDVDLIRLTGADDVWIKRLAERPNKRWAERVLQYAQEKGLFTVFLSALKQSKCAELFRAWLSDHEDLLALRKVALSGKGEDFDGKQAGEMLQDRLDQIREMMGDPLWPSRYMALKVLLYDDDERSRRALWEAFHDPHSLVRRTVVEEMKIEDEEGKEQLYTQLLRLLSDDFIFEVRAAAKKRLAKEFPDRPHIQFEKLTKVQKLHVVEQLDPASNEDRDFAVSVLEGKDDELSLKAARFLNEAGVLKQLFLNVDFSDRTALERNRALLEHAAAVNQIGFLDALPTADSSASWLIAAGLLSKKGSDKLGLTLVEKAGGLNIGTAPEHREVFEAAFSCACLREGEGSAKYIAGFLLKNRYDAYKASFILGQLDGRNAGMYVPVLLQLLRDPQFKQLEDLYAALLRFDSSFYLDELLDIIAADRDEHEHQVRIAAFQVVGRLKLPYCLQTILEHLPILPLEQAREFARHLADYSGKEFVKRAQAILAGEDGKVRAALIAALPETENKDFIKPIREALGDADPYVRSAAAWALLEYGDTRSIKQVRELLRDPVETVRRAAARALGEYGNDTTLAYFEELCNDENEVESVKLAAIKGLAFSKQEKAVDILVGYLKADVSPRLEEEVYSALSRKLSQKELMALVAHLKDAEHDMREKLAHVFTRMGYESEAMLVELLREDITSLRPYITSVLEETGFIDHTIRRLSHRDPQIRRDAAELLSLIGTVAAFRGIVLAARDPDEQVRVLVTKALERLNTKGGNEILQQLQEDPDPKIRKYTLWALERIKVRNSS
ncbi:MAG: HEAT repeat domain-containing protein [Spirochaetaceae bacterium]|nr:HEAT repeat domain-containing protein [Spirochaetaceae bacterium]MCF7951797.1 HEAT repeat domain-containing protein [Spirochaetaceae bacterium]